MSGVAVMESSPGFFGRGGDETGSGMEPGAVRRAFGHYPSGVVAIAAQVDGTNEVMVASSFTVGVSLDPPLTSVAVQHSSTTWPRLRRATTVGISLLESSQEALCRQLSGRDASRRWNGVEPLDLGDGALGIDGGAGYLACAIYAEHRAGDHDIIVLEVLRFGVDHSREPLVFHGSRFRSLVDGV